MNTRINSYAKIKNENLELKRKIQEIKGLLLLSNEKDIVLKIFKLLML